MSEFIKNSSAVTVAVAVLFSLNSVNTVVTFSEPLERTKVTDESVIDTVSVSGIMYKRFLLSVEYTIFILDLLMLN
tara:strand:- start:1623 stop:1850 length:228 start_codon:yes stop_codon:yes gene_type:complete